MRFLIYLLLFSFVPAGAMAKECTVSDYIYTPHPDYKSGYDPSSSLRLAIEPNPDFEPDIGGARFFYDIETYNPHSGKIFSKVRMPFECNSAGVMACRLNVFDQKSASLEVEIIKDFSSGSMDRRVPFALSIPGFLTKTKNSHDYPEKNILIKPDDNGLLPHFVPNLWVSKMEPRNTCGEAQ